jgi:hypothetical protein
MAIESGTDCRIHGGHRDVAAAPVAAARPPEGKAPLDGISAKVTRAGMTNVAQTPSVENDGDLFPLPPKSKNE